MAGKLKRLATEKPTQVKIPNFKQKITRNSQEQTKKKLQATVTFSQENHSSQYKWILSSDVGFSKQRFQRHCYKYIQRFVATVKTLKRKYNGTTKGESP